MKYSGRMQVGERRSPKGLMLGTRECVGPCGECQTVGGICQRDAEGEILLAPLGDVQSDVTQSCCRTPSRDSSGAAGTKCYRLHAAQHAQQSHCDRVQGPRTQNKVPGSIKSGRKYRIITSSPCSFKSDRKAEPSRAGFSCACSTSPLWGRHCRRAIK